MARATIGAEDAMGAVRMLECGEQAMVVELGSEIDPAINARVHHLARLLRKAAPDRILELVPTYRSLMIYFDPLAVSRKQLAEEVARLLPRLKKIDPAGDTRRIVTIPVCYGGEFGPDLEFVARHNGLTEDEFVRCHTATPLLIYMLGFTPGFPYLGGMPEDIAAPRLDEPRLKVPAGSVGIAGTQTGIYPVESPGGWRLIGRTPLKIFDPRAERPFLFSAGNYLEFVAIPSDEFYAFKEQVEAGSYAPRERLANIREANDVQGR
jgi:inhibitor of KinA